MPSEGSHPETVVFDLDGTLIEGDSFVRYLLFCLWSSPWRVVRCVHLPFVVLIYLLKIKNNSWLKQVFLQAVVGGLKAQRIEHISHVFSRWICNKKLKSQSRAKLQMHRELGQRIVLVSASPDLYVRLIARHLGIEHVYCTEVGWENDRCTGTLASQNVYGPAKLAVLDENAESLGVAYSDHHSDLELLLAAETGIAVDPTRELLHAATREGLCVESWRV